MQALAFRITFSEEDTSNERCHAVAIP